MNVGIAGDLKRMHAEEVMLLINKSQFPGLASNENQYQRYGVLIIIEISIIFYFFSDGIPFSIFTIINVGPSQPSQILYQ